MPTKDFKAELFSLLAEEPTTDLRSLSQRWGVSYAELCGWRTEYARGVREDNLAQVVDISPSVMPPERERMCDASFGELVRDVGRDGRAVTRLDTLQDKTQLTALRLVERITGMASAVSEPRDVKLLTSALSELHTAFFNQRNTQIAIMNGGGSGGGDVGEGGVQRFRSLMGA